jgi:tetratricopeptide (TPR) repeat protein
MASSDLNSIETWNIFGANSLYMGNLTMDTNGDCNAHIVADNTDEEKAELFNQLVMLLHGMGNTKFSWAADRSGFDVPVDDLGALIGIFEKAGFHVSAIVPNVHSAMSVSRSSSDQLELDQYTEEIGRHPEQPGGYRGRGAVYFELGEYGLAIEDWSAAIALDPENVDDAPYNNLALAYREVGEYNRAVELYSRAIELDPNWDYRYYTRGCCYLEMGEYRLAIADFNICIWMNPTFEAASEELDQAFRRLGEGSESV